LVAALRSTPAAAWGPIPYISTPNHPKHSITDHSEIQIQIMTNMPNSYEQVELLRKSIEDAKRLKAELEQSMAEIEKPVLEMKATAHNRATAHKKAKIKKSN
jgi:hypothetical protein